MNFEEITRNRNKKIIDLEAQNAQLLAALENVAKCEGAYSRDELTHARNTIENMAKIAEDAIAAVKPMTSEQRQQVAEQREAMGKQDDG